MYGVPITKKVKMSGKECPCPDSSPLERRKSNAPSRKKSLGYYNKANPTGTGAKAGVVWSAPKKVPLQPWVTRVVQSTVYQNHASPMN